MANLIAKNLHVSRSQGDRVKTTMNKIEGTPILKLALHWLKDYRSIKIFKKIVTKIRNRK